MMNTTQRAGLSMWFVAFVMLIAMTQFEAEWFHFVFLAAIMIIAASLFVPDRPTP